MRYNNYDESGIFWKGIKFVLGLIICLVLFLYCIHLFVWAVVRTADNPTLGLVGEKGAVEIMGRQHGTTNEMPVR